MSIGGVEIAVLFLWFLKGYATHIGCFSKIPVHILNVIICQKIVRCRPYDFPLPELLYRVVCRRETILPAFVSRAFLLPPSKFPPQRIIPDIVLHRRLVLLKLYHAPLFEYAGLLTAFVGSHGLPASPDSGADPDDIMPTLFIHGVIFLIILMDFLYL